MNLSSSKTGSINELVMLEDFRSDLKGLQLRFDAGCLLHGINQTQLPSTTSGAVLSHLLYKFPGKNKPPASRAVGIRQVIGVLSLIHI